MQKTKPAAGEQLVLFKRGIGIRDLVTIRGDVTKDIITDEK